MCVARARLLAAVVFCLLCGSLVPARQGPDAAAIARLVEQLGDEDYARRQEAAKQLQKIGAAALPALEKVVRGNGDPDVRLRAALVVRSISHEGWEEVRRIAGAKGYWLNRIAVTADGKHVVAAGGAVIVYDLDSGKELRRAYEVQGARPALALSRDGKLALTGHSAESTVRLIDVESLGIVKNFEGHPGGVSGVALSSDGNLAASCGADKPIRLWDVRSSRELRKLEGFPDRARCLALSPDGRRLLSGHHGDKSDFAVRLWDVKEGKELRVFRGHTAAVTAVAFVRSGQHFVSASMDGTVRLWDADKGTEVRRMAHAGGAHDVAVSVDGKWALSAGWEDHKARLWDLETGRELNRLEGHTGRVLGVAFAPDGKRAVSCDTDCTVYVWQPSR
jgi:WD40 repeat protein